jgi:hypothetical protein
MYTSPIFGYFTKPIRHIEAHLAMALLLRTDRMVKSGAIVAKLQAIIKAMPISWRSNIWPKPFKVPAVKY